MPKARVTRSFGAARLEEEDPPPEPEGDGPEGFSTPGADAGEDVAAAAVALWRAQEGLLRRLLSWGSW